MSDDKLKESDNDEINVDDYQAKDKTTFTKSDIANLGEVQDKEKNRKDNDDREDRIESSDEGEGK